MEIDTLPYIFEIILAEKEYIAYKFVSFFTLNDNTKKEGAKDNRFEPQFPAVVENQGNIMETGERRKAGAVREPPLQIVMIPAKES
ncbi:MAG: hypothetical protein D3904_04375 [Candidatus Electrothrix sp. EH2]|nr:hypothetical protein [Candidatus Electrothrix sp. EH2]